MSITETCSIIGAAIGITTLVLTVVKLWIGRSEKRMTRSIEGTRATLLTAFASTIDRQFRHKDKNTYVTLDYRMDGDVQCLRIPLDYREVVEPLEGMRLQLVSHNHRETVYSISTINHHAGIRFHWHYHTEMEVIQIIRGTVTDIGTGKVYGPGEIWVIEPNHRHSADFNECFALATCRPPLPYASRHPIDLHGIAAVYDALEPQTSTP